MSAVTAEGRDGGGWTVQEIEGHQRLPALSICQLRPYVTRPGLAKTTTPRRPRGAGGAKAWRAPQRRAEEQAFHGGDGSGERQRPGNHEPLSLILSHHELGLVVPISPLPPPTGPLFIFSRDSRGRPPLGAGVIGSSRPSTPKGPRTRRSLSGAFCLLRGRVPACLEPLTNASRRESPPSGVSTGSAGALGTRFGLRGSG